MKALQMLQKAHGTLKECLQVSDLEAFETLLQFIAYKIGYEPGIASPWMKVDLYNEINRIVNDDTLAAEKWDTFGDLAKELGLEFGGNQLYAMYRHQFQHLTEHTIEYFHNVEEAVIEQKPYRFLDPICGSGRMTIEVYKILYDDLVYYCAEPNVTLYRMALLNFKLMKIPAIVLNADFRIHDVSAKAQNWRHANMWNPLSQDKLEKAVKDEV